MTNTRLYRISKEMCPHHPEPPTFASRLLTITRILQVFISNFTTAHKTPL